jgi:hypothetical protein
MAYTIIQITRINTEPFVFHSPATVCYPVAPLISAKFYTPEGGGPLTLKIRATLYINSEDTTAPTVEIPTELNHSLQLYFDYNFSEETPESCDVWYIEIDYTSETVESLTNVVSYLKDIDPITSRGTTTSVGE